MLYKARKEAIKFFDDYSLMITEAKKKRKNNTSGKGHKILTNASTIAYSSCKSKSL